MSSQAIISIDAMGGDHGPQTSVAGVAEAVRAGQDARFLLHGDAKQLEPLLAQCDEKCRRRCEIRHTDTFVSMTDKPAEAIRRSRGSSMWNAIASVKAGEAQAALSAGNTGALMTISKVVLRMMEAVHRPAIAASWPTPKGYTVVLDVGANVEVDAGQLVEFAIMGEAFHRAVHHGQRPSVGLLNVGVEDVKGNRVVQAAGQMFRNAQLDMNYIGFVEGNDISMGVADVVVTDGFTGNVALKTAEGTAHLLVAFMREAFGAGLISKLGALLSRGALRRLKAKMDPNNVNGGVFLGLNGIVVKSHGGADAHGFATALRIAIEMANSDFTSEVNATLSKFAASRAGLEAEPAASALASGDGGTSSQLSEARS